MKVLATGAFCSGKTTLVNQLHSKFNNSFLVEDNTREVLDLFGKVDWSIPELRDYIFISQIIEEEKASLLNQKPIFVHAGIISLIAHDRILLKSSPNRLELLEYFKHTKYDVIFLCDHQGVPMEDDGERYTNEKLRANLTTVVEETLLSLDITDYIVLKGSKAQRLDQAAQIINERI